MAVDREKERLKALYSYSIMDTEAEKHYDSITYLAGYICKTSMSAINLIDDQRIWVKSKTGFDACEFSREVSFCKYTIQTDDIFEVKDALLDNRFKQNPLVTGELNIRYYAGVPLINFDGYVLGAICVFDTKPNELDEKQRHALKFLAEETILHVEAFKKNQDLQLLLKEQEEFQAVFNNSTELHFILNQEAKIEFVNQSIKPVLGYARDEVIGRCIWDFCTSEDRKNVLQKLKETLNRGEKQIVVETRMLTKNGENRWFSWSNVTINGQWLINGRDVTKDVVLREELQQLSLVASQVDNGVVINDANNNILWVNKAFEKITGYALQDVQGHKLRDFIIGKGSDKQMLEYAIGQSNNKTSFSIEILAYNKEQQPLWFSIMNSVILNEHGEINKSIEIITDITTKKNTELELQTLSIAVEKSEAGVLIRNGNEQVVWMNKALENIWGWKLSELKGFTLDKQFVGKDTDFKAYYDAKKQVFNKQSYDIEIELYRKDRTKVWLSVYNNLSFDHDGNVERQLSIITDITIRKKAEQELIRTREEALQLSRAKESFVSVMSHEIRTPINAIIGMSRFLLEENPAPHQMENLNTLNFSSENLLRLVNDVLDFTKIETGNMVLESAPVNLKDLARRILHTLEFKLEDKQLKLKLAIDAAIPDFVLADSTRLYQILINLLGNAVKFTDAGEVALTLNLEKEDQETVTVYFAVSDTGIGIPPDKLDSIFEAYTQASTDTTRKYGGTGLGLTITKKLIELHHSTIKVKSDPGHGAEFSFSINFKRMSDKFPLAVSSHKFENLDATVLVADDDLINRTLAKKVLSKWGIQTDIAENGLVAFEMIVQKDYDLILMDMHMPIMDGLEATKKIRQLPDEKYRTVPIIALTGSVFGIDLEILHEDGMTDYFLKPYTPEGIYNKIKPYLKKQLVVND